MTIRAIILVVAVLIPMSAGAQEPADCVGVFDADGTRIGRLGGGEPWVVRFDVGTGAVLFRIFQGEFQGTSLYFTDANCLTAPWIVLSEAFGWRNFDGTALFYPDPTAEVSIPSIQSVLSHDTDVCQPSSGTPNLVPALQFPIAFTTPFHLEAEECTSATAAGLGPRSLLAMALVLVFGAVLMKRRSDRA